MVYMEQQVKLNGRSSFVVHSLDYGMHLVKFLWLDISQRWLPFGPLTALLIVESINSDTLDVASDQPCNTELVTTRY